MWPHAVGQLGKIAVVHGVGQLASARQSPQGRQVSTPVQQDWKVPGVTGQYRWSPNTEIGDSARRTRSL